MKGSTINTLSVFCGSSAGNEALFADQAYQLGKSMAQKGIKLVYGGTNVGLMGRVADGILENGGKAIGILPGFLRDREIAHEGLSELILVDTLQQRKAMMNEISDGAIALPGGFGTMEEYFEMLTWGQLHIHTKPVGLLNIMGFYNPLLQLMNTMVACGFLKNVNREMVIEDDDIEELLSKMRGYTHTGECKWIKR